VVSSEAPRTVTAGAPSPASALVPTGSAYARDVVGAGSASGPGVEPADSTRHTGASNGAPVTEPAVRPTGTRSPSGKLPPGRVAKGKAPSKLAPELDDDAPAKPSAKPEPVAPPVGKKSAAAQRSDQGSDEPSFDELVKQANIAPPKQVLTKRGKQALTADDIKRGMAAVAPAAEGCSVGTAGLASVRLTVAPSGQVTKVTITGPFAGTPVAACVERAVRAARFPPWDGGPQSFGYSYLLPE